MIAWVAAQRRPNVFTLGHMEARVTKNELAYFLLYDTPYSSKRSYRLCLPREIAVVTALFHWGQSVCACPAIALATAGLWLIIFKVFSVPSASLA